MQKIWNYTKEIVRLFIIILFIFTCNRVYAFNEYKIGDKVSYNNESYHVIVNSNADTDYVVLFKDKALSREDIIKYGGGEIVADNNEVSFHPGCDSINIENGSCGFINFDVSDINYLLENWASQFKNDLKFVNGFKVRLIQSNELMDNFDFDHVFTGTGSEYYELNNLDYAWLIDGVYWTMSPYENENHAYYAMIDSILSYMKIYDKAKVKPVINLKKAAIEDIEKETNNSDTNKNNNQNKNNKQEILYNSYNIGDDVIYNNELYHVISDSSNNDNYVTLLKDKPLTYDEIDKYGKNANGYYYVTRKISDNEFVPDISNFDDGIGGIKYFYSNCFYKTKDIEYNYCSSNYDKSIVRAVVNNWSKNIDEDLVKVNGYRARLINSDEINNVIQYDWAGSDNYIYWSMDGRDSFNVIQINQSPYISSIWNSNAIRPVINLNKCAVELNNPTCVNYNVSSVKCNAKKTTMYKTFIVGDEVNYRGEKYYVIANSNNMTNYVTLLKKDYLSLNDVESYKQSILKNISISNLDGYISGNDNIYSTPFNQTIFKKILDNWVKTELDENDLIDINGYKARIISFEDIMNSFSMEQYHSDSDNQNSEFNSYYFTNNTPDAFNNNYFGHYWVMSDNDNISFWYLDSIINSIKTTLLLKYNTTSHISKAILPVINLKKEVLGSRTDYNIGDIVTYKNNQYIVIENSNNEKNYLVLLKKQALNKGQILLYRDDNMIFSTPYYIGENCDSSDVSGCKTSYNTSLVKTYIDEWSKDFTNDLIEVEGYKSRIINLYDLVYNLEYENDRNYSTSYVYCKTNNTPSWVYNDEIPYWSMEIYEDSNYLVYQNNINGCLNTDYFTFTIINKFQSSPIRPVINLNKCVLDGGCYEVEQCSEINTSIVDVDKTLRNIPKVILITSCLLLIIGISFIIYNYYRSLKK